MRYFWQSGSGKLSLILTGDQADIGSHQGECLEDIRWLLSRPEILEQVLLWDTEDLKQELDGYGAWDEEELSDHEKNVERMLWLACGDVNNNQADHLEGL